MGRHLYACNASLLEFCQYPYSPKRELPFGTEPPAAAVFESGRVRLYTFCKTADSIAVSFDMDEIKQRFYLESDGNGNWGADIFELPPGRYIMYWYYDGVLKLNRHAPVCYEKGEIRNFIEIPMNIPGEYELQDVLHGTLRQEYLQSKVYEGFLNCWVYTPPGYDRKAGDGYPVLYLVSGMEGNETSWFGNIRLDMIADNLLAEGKCREMLMVSVCTQETAMRKAEEFLLKDVIPFVESHFSVRPDARHRAIAGFSDGARQAEDIALHNPGIFAYTGALKEKEAWLADGSGRHFFLNLENLRGMQLWRMAACIMLQTLFKKE